MDVVLGAETQGIQKYTEPWDQLSIAKLVPNSCFRSKEDYWACREEFGTILCIFWQKLRPPDEYKREINHCLCILVDGLVPSCSKLVHLWKDFSLHGHTAEAAHTNMRCTCFYFDWSGRFALFSCIKAMTINISLVVYFKRLRSRSACYYRDQIWKYREEAMTLSSWPLTWFLPRLKPFLISFLSQHWWRKSSLIVIYFMKLIVSVNRFTN